MDQIQSAPQQSKGEIQDSKPCSSRAENMSEYVCGRGSSDSSRYLDEEDMSPLERGSGEEELRRCLEGKAPSDSGSIIDVVVHPADLQFTPMVKKTVHYIVAAVVVNSKGQVLMMQEAKAGCRGKWYLPAGRMERNELIIESVRREVFEETGLDCDPVSLIFVERSLDMWVRFTLYCQQRGGRLKGKANADQESLQARWFSEHEISEHSVYFPLRSGDILPLIERGRQYHDYYNKVKPASLTRQHKPTLPALVAHKSMLIRAIIVQQTVAGNVYVLFARRRRLHLPVATLFSRGGDPQPSFRELFKSAFGLGVQQFKVHGVVAIEHDGKPAYDNDGVLMTALVSVDIGAVIFPAKVVQEETYVWLRMEEPQLSHELVERCEPLMSIPLYRH